MRRGSGVPGPGRAIGSLLEVVRFFSLRFLPLAALISGFHYLLSLVGWNDAWMPVICVAFAYLVVMGQGVVFPDKSAGLREFYWISVFFVLTTPLLQFAPLGLDHYNFHLVTGFGGTMMPYMLALLVNLTLAWTAGLMFHLLWRWRYRDGTTVGGTVTGAASVTLPPSGVVYAVVMVITNFSVTVQLSAVFAVLPMAFSLLLVFRDTGVTFTERDRQTLFPLLTAAACVSVLVGMAVIMSIYLSPDFPSVLPDHNLVKSWELDSTLRGTRDRRRGPGEPRLHMACHVPVDLYVMRGGRQTLVEIHRMGEGGR